MCMCEVTIKVKEKKPHMKVVCPFERELGLHLVPKYNFGG
jgi:hypothetical protein